MRQEQFLYIPTVALGFKNFREAFETLIKMGYYTSHKLEIIEGNDYVTDYEKEIGEVSGYRNPFDDSCKWYEHEKDMRAYSKKHPKTLFKLSGDGEKNGDLWHEYYLNGKMQRVKAEIVFANYDASKLQ